jgi:hypothetical protein
VSAGPSTGSHLSGVAVDTEEGLLRVETVFHVTDESQGQAVAAKLIDRAHELANSPECECDVDVSVEWVQPGSPGHRGGLPAGAAPPASGRSVER